MIEDSNERTPMSEISSRRRVTSRPSLRSKAAVEMSSKWRGKNNRNTDDFLPQSTGSVKQPDNGSSTEVPFGGSSKTSSTEVRLPAVHTTYLSLAKARAARRTAHEERMMELGQTDLSDQNQEVMKPGTDKKRKPISHRNKPKAPKKCVMILGLKRQTNGDFLIASIDNKIGNPMLSSHILNRQAHVSQAHPSLQLTARPMDDLNNFSNVLLQSVYEDSLSKIDSKNFKPSTKYSSTSNGGIKALSRVDLQCRVDSDSAIKQSQELLPTGLPPQSLKNISDNETNGNLGDNENKVNTADVRESRSVDNPLNSLDLADILHKLESTLETLQQGKSPSRVEPSSRLKASGDSIQDGARVGQNLTEDIQNPKVKKKPRKIASSSGSSLQDKASPASLQTVGTYPRVQRTSRSSFQKAKKTKPNGQASTQKHQKSLVLTNNGHKTQTEALSRSPGSKLLAKPERIAESPSSEASRTDDTTEMGAAQPKLAPTASSDGVTEESLPSSLENGNGFGKQLSSKSTEENTGKNVRESVTKHDISDKSTEIDEDSKAKDTEANIPVSNKYDDASSLSDRRKESSKKEESVNNVALQTDQTSYAHSNGNKEKTKQKREAAIAKTKKIKGEDALKKTSNTNHSDICAELTNGDAKHEQTKQRIENNELSKSEIRNRLDTQRKTSDIHCVEILAETSDDGGKDKKDRITINRETAQEERVQLDADIDSQKAAAQKRDEQRKISAALSRGGTSGVIGSTSVPSLLSQPSTQQQQQQHQLLPTLPQQPSYPGVVPASSVAYSAEPAPLTGDTPHTSEDQGRILLPPSEYNGHHPAAHYSSLHGDVNGPDLRDDPLNSQVITQLPSHVAEDVMVVNIPESPVNRRRRQGRDHTNWAPPPNLSHLLRESIDTRPGDTAITTSTTNIYKTPTNGFIPGDQTGEEGLQLIVLDKTDDEDEDEFHPPYSGSRTNGGGSTAGFHSRSESKVFPVDRRAVERDLFKQEYSPPQISELPESDKKVSRSGFVRFAGTDSFPNLSGRQRTVHGDFRGGPDGDLPGAEV